MGIHYDYKSTRGEKALKKEAKRKARIEERRAKRGANLKNHEPKEKIHDILVQDFGSNKMDYNSCLAVTDNKDNTWPAHCE